MLDPVELSGSRVLITGATGQVAAPVVAALAGSAEVFAVARFGKEEDRQRIAALGATCVSGDLADPEGLRNLPRDVDYVINFAVSKSGLFDQDLAANAEGVGRLMLHCAEAKAFLHFSSTAVYQYAGHEPLRESAALGDNHRAMFPTYSISKIAGESVCRFTAAQFGIPATIARLSVPYGDNGGWPFYHLLMMKEGIPIDIHPETPNIEEWCAWLTELTGLEPVFNETPTAFGSLCIDTTWMHELVGPTRVDWKDGIRRLVQSLAPDLLRKT